MTKEQITENVLNYIDIKLKETTDPDKKYELLYKDLVSQLQSELNYINEIVQDYTDNNLRLATIEAEGYKRCLITMLNNFKETEKEYLND